jgi:glycosyltransferase involved in cell wall biosynthesis
VRAGGPLLSACFIVRDEERFLPGALDSIAGVADEIVVVDTGSTDATVAIASARGARIVHHAWQDDFGAARNAAQPHACGAWLLWLDADERLVDGGGLRARLEATPADVGGFVIERHDLVTHAGSGRADVFPVGMVRLFRNDPRIHWIGAVHERPGDTIVDAGLSLVVATEFKLAHLVNALGPEQLRGKQARYLRLLDSAVGADASDAWARYYRGKTRWYLGLRDEALADFAAVAAQGARPFLRASAHAMRAALLDELGRSDAALASIDESLRLAPDQSLAHALLGEIRYGRGEYEEALAAWRRVRLSLAAAPGDAVPGDLYMTAEKRAFKIGCALLALGRLQEAAQSFDEGLRANERDAGCWFGLAHVARQRGDVASARRMLAVARTADPGWREPREMEEQLGSAGPARDALDSRIF